MNRTIHITIFTVYILVTGSAQDVTKSIRLASSHGVGSSPISADRLKKNDRGEYFMITTIAGGGDFYIGQDTFLFEPIPGNDEDDVTFLIKLSPSLNILKVVKLRGVRTSQPDLALSENRVFIGSRNSQDVTAIDNELIYIDSKMRGVIYEFDHDLNFLDTPLVIKQELEHIEAFGDSTLYINARLNSIDTMIFDTDTLFNFGDFSQWRTNTIINYNYKKQEVEFFWKYGSLVDDSTVGLEVDSDGDIYVGSNFGWWIFSIDGETEIDNIAGATDCIIKFSPEGEVIWSTYDPWHNPTTLRKIKLLDNEEIIAIYTFSSTQYLSITGDTIYAQTTPNSQSTTNIAIVKYDSIGLIDWLYNVDGLNLDNHLVNGIEVFGDTLEVLNFISSCDSLVLGNNIYKNLYLDQAFIYLDINNGEVLDGYVIENEDDMSLNVPQYINCNYVERFENSKMQRVVFWFIREQFDLYGQSWGEAGVNTQYIFELDGEMLSQVNKQVQPSYFRLYPNPVIKDSEIYLDMNQDVIGNWQICNAKGELVKSISQKELMFGQENSISLTGLSSGVYFIQFRTEDSYQTEIIIIE